MLTLLPPALLGISSLAFFAAFPLSRNGRLLVSPILFGSALLSLQKSHLVDWTTGFAVVWALFTCIWIMHAFTVLFLSPLHLPPSAPIRKWTYKIYNDPRRLMGWPSFPPLKETTTTTPSARISFIFHRLTKVAFFYSLQTYLIRPAISSSFTLSSADFSPARQILLRRLLFPSTYPDPFTAHELAIRLYISTYWIWTAYYILDACNIFLSIFFVGVLRIDTPQEWPSLFGSPMQAYSIRRFWTKFWHRLSVSSCVSSGRYIAQHTPILKNNVLPGSRMEKTFLAFWSFFVSGLVHVVSDWGAGELVDPCADMTFFMACFAAGAAESILVEKIDRLWKLYYGDNVLRRWAWSETGRKVIGFAWVLGFFFWIGPKWQYGKIHTVLLQYGV